MSVLSEEKSLMNLEETLCDSDGGQFQNNANCEITEKNAAGEFQTDTNYDETVMSVLSEDNNLMDLKEILCNDDGGQLQNNANCENIEKNNAGEFQNDTNCDETAMSVLSEERNFMDLKETFCNGDDRQFQNNANCEITEKNTAVECHNDTNSDETAMSVLSGENNLMDLKETLCNDDGGQFQKTKKCEITEKNAACEFQNDTNCDETEMSVLSEENDLMDLKEILCNDDGGQFLNNAKGEVTEKNAACEFQNDINCDETEISVLCEEKNLMKLQETLRDGNGEQFKKTKNCKIAEKNAAGEFQNDTNCVETEMSVLNEENDMMDLKETLCNDDRGQFQKNENCEMTEKKSVDFESNTNCDETVMSVLSEERNLMELEESLCDDNGGQFQNNTNCEITDKNSIDFQSNTNCDEVIKLELKTEEKPNKDISAEFQITSSVVKNDKDDFSSKSDCKEQKLSYVSHSELDIADHSEFNYDEKQSIGSMANLSANNSGDQFKNDAGCHSTEIFVLKNEKNLIGFQNNSNKIGTIKHEAEEKEDRNFVTGIKKTLKIENKNNDFVIEKNNLAKGSVQTKLEFWEGTTTDSALYSEEDYVVELPNDTNCDKIVNFEPSFDQDNLICNKTIKINLETEEEKPKKISTTDEFQNNVEMKNNSAGMPLQINIEEKSFLGFDLEKYNVSNSETSYSDQLKFECKGENSMAVAVPQNTVNTTNKIDEYCKSITEEETTSKHNYKCVHCPKTFDDAFLFIDHLKYDHCLKYICRFCFDAFSYSNSLNHHIKKLHRSLQCNKCTKTHKNYQHYYRHFESCYREKEKFVKEKCSNCNKMFLNKTELMKHQAEMHSVKVETEVLDEERSVNKHEASVDSSCLEEHAPGTNENFVVIPLSGNKNADKYLVDVTECLNLENECQNTTNYNKAIKTEFENMEIDHDTDDHNNVQITDKTGEIKIDGYCTSLLQRRDDPDNLKAESLNDNSPDDSCQNNTNVAEITNHKIEENSENLDLIQNHKSGKYSCYVCSAMFENLDIFNKHLEAHKQPECFKCGAIFPHHASLAEHYKNHHSLSSEQDFLCFYCRSTFKNVWNLFSHLKKTHNFNNICCICFEGFSHSAPMNFHIKQFHKKLKCNKCSKTLKNYNYLYRHFQICYHRQTEINYCEICSNVFSSKASLRRHRSNVHGIKITGASNEIAKDVHILEEFQTDKVFETIYLDESVSLFEKSQEANNLEIYENALLQTSPKMISPARNATKPIKNCTESNVQKTPNEDNTEMPKIKSKRSHLCYMCFAKNFATTKEFSQHIRGHIQLKCSRCHVIFASHAYLVKHFRKFHAVAKHNYVCSHCPKAFNHVLPFMKHLQHFHLFKYICRICFEGFPSQCPLSRHVKQKHETFQCRNCSKMLINYKSYRSHFHRCYTKNVINNVNNNPKNVKCGICNKEFSNNIMLHKHKLKMHAIRALNKRLPETKLNVSEDMKISESLADFHKSETAIEPIKEDVTHNSKIYKRTRNVTEKNANEVQNIATDVCPAEIKDNVKKTSIVVNYEAEKRFRKGGTSRIYLCYMCLDKFEDFNMFKAHLKKHCSYKCFKCDGNFAHHASLVNHYKKFHSISEHRFVCCYCPNTFRDVWLLIGHLQRDHHYKNICRFCFQGFPYSNPLNKHIKRDHKELQCNNCLKKCITYNCFYRHFQKCYIRKPEVVVTKIQPNIICKKCKRPFPHKKALRQHHSKVHGNQRRKLSDGNLEIAEEKEATITSSSSETESDTDTSSKLSVVQIFECLTCSDMYESKADRWEHMDKGHNEAVCKVCRTITASFENLFRHFNRSHPGHKMDYEIKKIM